MPYTLLLADDSVTIQRVIELTFADEDVTVVAVSDGDQAIERLDASPPDIVLADIGMPGKNGYEVAQYIRQTPRLAHIPVVLLTGAFEPVDQARAAEAGCDGVLAKPFEPQLVIGRVKELLARSHRVPGGMDSGQTASLVEAVDQWSPPAADPLLEASPANTRDGLAGLDDYFDRLDAAFSNLSSTAPPPPAPGAAPPAPASFLPGDTEIDWFSAATPGASPSAEPWDLPAPPAMAEAPDLPLSYASPEAPSPFPSFEPEVFAAPPAAAPAAAVAPALLTPTAVAMPSAPAPAPAPASVAPAASAPAPPAPVAVRPASFAPASLPPLADAFAALLAAEQSEPPPAGAPAWPATMASAPVAGDQLIEDVTRRVLDRLSDQVVRDTVAGIVSKVAEQLVRDEIDRIKASLK